MERQIAVTLHAAPVLAIGVAFNRSGGDFNERDRAVLALLPPFLIAAHRRADERTRSREALRVLDEALDGRGRGVLLVDPYGCIEFATAAAERLLDTYFGAPSRQGGGLPSRLAQWLASNGSDAPDPLIVGHGDRRLVVHPRRNATAAAPS